MPTASTVRGLAYVSVPESASPASRWLAVPGVTVAGSDPLRAAETPATPATADRSNPPTLPLRKVPDAAVA